VAGEFEWTPEPWGLALRCRSLSAIADHFFTTRQLELRGRPEVERLGWAAVAATIGVAPGRLVRLTQVHGTAAFEVREGCEWSGGEGQAPDADIALGRDPSYALVVKVADCVPLLLADPVTGSVAAVHAGWRGTAASAAGRAVAMLAARWAAEPRDLVAAVGPSIGPCCYEVGEDVRAAFRAAGHHDEALARWFATVAAPAGEARRWRLDLWAATREQLLSAGLDPARIHVARLCTASHPDLFCSYRRDGPRAGRLAGVIRSKGPQPRPSRGWPADRPPHSPSGGRAGR